WSGVASRRASDPCSGAVRGFDCAAKVELIVSDARISFRIEQIGDEVYDDEDDRHEEDAPLDRGEVSLVDRGEHVTSQPRPAEDRLGEDAAGEIVPVSSPNTVITGTSAVRKPCRSTTARSGNPLARAVRMKSLDSTSSIAARVMRARKAIDRMPSVTAGSTSAASPPDPEGGSQRSANAKTRISSSPTQYTGKETPT